MTLPVLNQPRGINITNMLQPSIPQLQMTSQGISHAAMADYIMQVCTFKTLTDTEEVLCYDYSCGFYRYHGEAIIKQLVEETLVKNNLVNNATRNFINEVIGHIQRKTYTDRENFNSTSDLLIVNNGILNLDTVQLSHHTHNLLSTIRVPVVYDPNADSPLIRKFFSEIVAPEYTKLLAELFGWCLDQNINIQKLILLLGGGANGKSTFLELLRRFLGIENCSAVPLQSFSTNRFALAALYGKLANIFADLRSTSLYETASIKTLTGGDTIQAEEKFRPPFSFLNKAKMIFSANTPPRIPDEDTFAIWRRFVLIDFPNQFVGEKADRNLIYKLTAEKELSGLLNMALEGLQRIKKNGDFSYNQSWVQTKEKYQLQSDPVSAFIENRCELIYDSEISKINLYKAFNVYCAENKIPLITIRAFGHRVIQKNIVTDRQAGGIEYWVGIKLKQ